MKWNESIFGKKIFEKCEQKLLNSESKRNKKKLWYPMQMVIKKKRKKKKYMQMNIFGTRKHWRWLKQEVEVEDEKKSWK